MGRIDYSGDLQRGWDVVAGCQCRLGASLGLPSSPQWCDVDDSDCRGGEICGVCLGLGGSLQTFRDFTSSRQPPKWAPAGRRAVPMTGNARLPGRNFSERAPWALVPDDLPLNRLATEWASDYPQVLQSR